jgi:hypothetical protein
MKDTKKSGSNKWAAVLSRTPKSRFDSGARLKIKPD